MEENNQQNVNIAKIVVDIEWLKKEMTDVKDNHLHSIYNKLDRINIWLIGLLTSVILTFVGVVLNLVLKK